MYYKSFISGPEGAYRVNESIMSKLLVLTGFLLFVVHTGLDAQCFPNIKALDGACLNDTTCYVADTGASFSYNWSVTGGTLVSGAGTDTVYVLWTQQGDVSISCTITDVPNSCVDNQTYEEYVNEVVMNPVTGGNPTIVCPLGDSAVYSLFFNNDPGGGQHTPSWSVIGGGMGNPQTYAASVAPFLYDTVKVKWNQAGLSQLMVTLSHDYTGCSTSDTITIAKHPGPIADFCWVAIGTNFIFQNLTIADSSVNYYWTFGDGGDSYLSDPFKPYFFNGTYNVCLYATDTCGADTICKNVVVPCVQSMAVFGSQTNGLTATFTDSTAGATEWYWEFGDGDTSTLQNPTHTYLTAGNYKVCLTASNQCGWAETCTTVAATCTGSVAGFSESQNGLEFEFTDNSTGGGFRWWDFGDGNTSTDKEPTHTYAANGVYTVCQSVWNGCMGDSVCKTISLNCPVPVAAWTDSIDSLTVYFTDDSQDGGTPMWDFGDGTTDTSANPVHTYAQDGFYYVCLTHTTLCGTDSVCNTVQIGCAIPVSGWTVNHQFYDAFFADTSENVPTSWKWTFGNSGPGKTSNQQNPYKQYADTGWYEVCLIATNVCGSDTSCDSIHITCPTADVGFTHSANLLAVDFTDTTGFTLTAWEWDFGDGNTSTQQNPSHTYSSAGTYEVCLIGTNQCGDDTLCDSITVICTLPVSDFSWSNVDTTVTFSDSSTTAASYNWDFGDGGTSTFPSPIHHYASLGTYTVCQTVTNICGTDSSCQTITLTCTPSPANYVFNSTNLTTSFTNLSFGTTSWLWDFGDGNTSTQSSPVHTYASNGTYTVCLTANDSCGSDSLCKTVTVSCPPPSSNFGYSATALTVTFSDSSTNAASWSWDFDGSGSSTQQNPTYTFPSNGSYTICLAIADTCGGNDTTCQTISVSCPAPVAGFNSAASALTVTFTDVSSNASSWNWTFGDGGSSTQQNPVHVYPSNGIYTVCLAIADTCGGNDTLCKTVTAICPVPVAGFTYSANALTVSFTDASSNPGNWVWTFGDGASSNQQNPSHTYAANGIYTVCLSISDTCGGSDSSCQVLNVSCPAPVAGFSHSASALTVGFSDTSANASSWSWTFGDGGTSTQQSPTHIYPSNGSYTICLAIADTCGGSDSTCKTIAVACPAPAAAFTNTASALTLTFTDVSANASSWSWTFGDGATATQQNPTHIYAQNGTYTICLSIADTCGGSDSTCQTIAVSCPAPVASFSVTTSSLTAGFSDGSANASTWSWAFGDGATSTQQNPTHTYATNGSYTACVVIADTCGGADSSCKTVNVSCPAPVANFNSSSVSWAATFTDISSNASSWNWDFGDGNTSTTQSPSHTYSANGNYTVCLTIADTCGGTDSTCKTVPITCIAPVSNFSDSSNLLTAFFSDLSTNANSWSWDFGDGNTSTAQNPTHNYAAAGTYTVCLITSSSCALDTACKSVVITCPLPQANFTFTSTSLTASFTDAATGAQSYLWDFGDGNSSTATNPSHTYQSSGTYTVCQTATSVCGSDSTCKSVQIICTTPVTGFTYSNSFDTATFADTSAGATSWNWDFGDGNNSTQQNPSHIYANYGTYTVCLVTSNICGSDSTCNSVVVSCPVTTSSFTHSTNLYTATFTDNSTTVTSWLWNFGDGNSSTSQNPMHTYAANGTYQACLTAMSKCDTATSCDSVTINCQIPVSTFTSTSNGDTATFTDNSNGATSWLWNYGDGNTDTTQNPSHIYAAYGTYTVCLTTTNVCGTDSSCNSITVSCISAQAAFTSTVSLFTASFTNTSGNASSWSWSFGDGSQASSLTSPSHTYASNGTYQVCLTAMSLCDTATTCDSVTINCPAPFAAFADSIYGDTVAFTDASSGVLSWLWDFGDGSSDTTQNPTHIYGTIGTFTVCLTTTNQCGTDSTCKLINLACPIVISKFNVSTNLLTATFTDSTSNATAWNWNFGDGDTSLLMNPVHTYDSAGDYLVCLTAMSNCDTAQFCDTVSVICPAPIAGFSYTISGLTVSFNDTSQLNIPTGWFWDFGDGNTSTSISPTHTFTGNGSYNVCMEVYDTCGADTACEMILITGGIHDLHGSVELYPNPAANQVRVQWPEYLTPERLVLSDLHGKKVYICESFEGRNFREIDLRDVADGTYLIRIRFSDGVTGKRLVIIH